MGALEQKSTSLPQGAVKGFWVGDPGLMGLWLGRSCGWRRSEVRHMITKFFEKLMELLVLSSDCCQGLLMLPQENSLTREDVFVLH